MWESHERREAINHPMGLSGKLMMQLEERALQQEGHTWKDHGKDSSSQSGRQNSSQRPVGS